jgi:probable selenium-dependent hydroxylase accessory protein YqeC
MIEPEPSIEDFLSRFFPPGQVATFVGAGGKSSGMRVAASILSGRGLRMRITTTTRIGVEEFSSFPVAHVRREKDILDSLASEQPVQVISAGMLDGNEKHRGLEPEVIERMTLPPDLILLVEGDGSRRMPVKAPLHHEPVIPANSAIVFALMGASAFDQGVESRCCYNPEGVLALVGKKVAVFDVPTLSLLAGDPGGCRKGVKRGMAFHLVVNQGDLADRRPTAHALLREARKTRGISATLLSWQEQRIYETAW